MNSIDSPYDLLFDQIKDLYSAACQIEETLPDLAGWASSSDLRRLLTIEHGEMEARRTMLGKLCKERGFDPGGDECQAMKGLIEGGNVHIERATEGKVRDLLLIAHYSRIKHYQIGGTRFASSLADCIELTRESGELGAMENRYVEVLAELAQVGANFFSPCLLESGSL